MPKTAFVLAGGGTKGAFEAGALSYLVKECRITPQVITAASAGAVCAIVLAQARTEEEFVVRVDELHEDLLAMTDRDLLFGRQPWVAALDGTPLSRLVDGYLIEGTRPPRPGGDGATACTVGGIPTKVVRRRRKVRLLKGALRLLPRLGWIRRELKANPSSVLTLEPLAQALRRGGPSGIKAVDLNLVARPGLELRLAVTALRAGVLRYVTESGTITESDAVSPVAGEGAGPVDVLEAVVASSSVPLVFPPRSMGDDDYVDGGVVNNVPVDAAARLGATRIVAILAVPLNQPRDDRDFTKVHALDVFLRSVGAIAFAEHQEDSLRPPLSDGVEVTVVDPRLDVVGPFEVAQGLMLIDMDYGWLRAADVMAGLDPDLALQANESTEELVRNRVEAWHLEDILRRHGSATSPDVGKPLAEAKQAVRSALERRRALGLPCPPQADAWWKADEVHGRPRRDGASN